MKFRSHDVFNVRNISNEIKYCFLNNRRSGLVFRIALFALLVVQYKLNLRKVFLSL